MKLAGFSKPPDMNGLVELDVFPLTPNKLSSILVNGVEPFESGVSILFTMLKIPPIGADKLSDAVRFDQPLALEGPFELIGGGSKLDNGL